MITGYGMRLIYPEYNFPETLNPAFIGKEYRPSFEHTFSNYYFRICYNYSAQRRQNMIWGGIQKLTLLDYPDKTACTLFTAGCNYKCPFCHNAALINRTGHIPTIATAAMLDFLKTRRGLLDGVCISGGEPLLHKDLGDFLSEVKTLGFLVKLDTNGSFPDELVKLVESGAVDYVALDIKNVPEKYGQTIGMPDYDIAPIEKSKSFLLSGTVPYEFRTTVVRELHTEEDLLSLAAWIKGAAKYYLQSFIDSGDVLKNGLTGYSATEMQLMLGKIKAALPCAELRGA